MPRSYAKKNKINEDDAQSAVGEWKEKKDSLRNIAKKYNLDKSLLSRRISGQMLQKRGRKTAISLEAEGKLASHLRDMAQWGFALTTKEIKNVVADYVSQNNISTPFNSNTGRPGKDWMTNFLRRHNLSIRNLEKL